MLTSHSFSTRQIHPTAPHEAPLPSLPPLAPQEPYRRSASQADAGHFARALDRSHPAESQDFLQLHCFYYALRGGDDPGRMV